jgi:Acetyltransferase (isoleucine patch superfamily)
MRIRGFLKVHRGWLRLCAKAFTVLARGDFRRLGARSTLSLPIRLHGTEHIAIGERVFVGPNSWLEVLSPEEKRPQPALQIGDGTSIAGFCTITSRRGVVIERNVLIARYAYISDHAHAHAAQDLPIKEQGIADVAPVRIREGAWLGQNVVVCPGVTIGRNAVIGANSVVKTDVPDFCVAVGAPARVVRCNFPTPVT